MHIRGRIHWSLGVAVALSCGVLAADDFYVDPIPRHSLNPGFEIADEDLALDPTIQRHRHTLDPAAEENPVWIPEPLLFDLVRPLGARQGELEANVLAAFPWKRLRRDPDRDPFGPGATTPDRRGIEWAPEIEYAVTDGFAIEFEFPFEDATLEEYKLGLQWTFGTAFDNQFIHGLHVLIEPNTEWLQWNTSWLYVWGIRFDEHWSMLGMAGIRLDLEGSRQYESFDRLLNVSIFREVSDRLVLGVETNYAGRFDGTPELIIVPQLHYEFTKNFEIQAGLGFGFTDIGSEELFIMRAIWAN